MVKSFEKLIELLEKLPITETTDSEGDGYEGMPVPEYHTNWKEVDESVNDEIESICCSLFIKNGGQVDFDMVHRFNDENDKMYYVRRGDGDSFGWVTGCVMKHTEDGGICHCWTFG